MFDRLNEIYPIGIDIHDQHVYAAQFQPARQGPALRDLFDRELNERPDSPEWESALVSALKAVSKSRRFSGKRAAVHLPSRHVNCFPISFGVAGHEPVDLAIARECRKHISFPVEQAVIDYPAIVDNSSGDEKRFEAYIVVAPRVQIERHVRLLKRAGLSADAIDLDLSSLLRLHHHLFSHRDDPVVVCNVGRHQTMIAIVAGDDILARRNTSWGMQGLFNRLAANLELPGDNRQAAEMLSAYGLRYDDHVQSQGDPDGDKDGQPGAGGRIEIYRSLFQILAPYADVLVNEFYQIFGYVRSKHPGIRFEKVWMYGQAITAGSLDRYLELHLGIPAESINPLTKLDPAKGCRPADTAGGAPFALALGLALRKVTWL